MPVNLETISLVKDIISIVSPVIATAIALYGLSSWKTQIRVQKEYDLARRMLIAIYKYRDAFRQVAEQAVEKPSDLPKSDFVALREAKTSLSIELLEARIMWSDEKGIKNSIASFTKNVRTIEDLLDFDEQEEQIKPLPMGKIHALRVGFRQFLQHDLVDVERELHPKLTLKRQRGKIDPA